MTEWPELLRLHTRHALMPMADATRAAGAKAYMKDVAPFLGISAPDRRRALRRAWLGLRAPSSDELGDAALLLMQERDREFHYAAYDAIAHWFSTVDGTFLPKYGEALILSTPWWDTVDGLVTAMVSPCMQQFHHDALIDRWSESGNRWLIRAALGHQRGWKSATETHRVLQLCERHWNDTEFFVAKAIGWALRDLARLHPDVVEGFLNDQQYMNRIAIREARRGLGS